MSSGLSKNACINKLRRIRSWSALFCLIGILLSCYAFYVEHKKENDNSYVAMCDISEHMSCSRVFSSKYGKGFGLLQLFLDDDSPLIQPNPVYGVVFYFLVLTLGLTNFKFMCSVQLLLCISGNLGSVYLGYILYFILQDFCVVCVSTYVVNFILLLLCLLRRSNLKSLYDAEASTTPAPYYSGPITKTKKQV